jgi:peptide/nickel transport system permease protein
MTAYVTHRLLQTLVVLLLMSVAVYGLIWLMPGDPIDLMVSANPDLTAADGARLRALYGLDRPFAERYLAWLQAALGGDLGYSRQYARPVLEIAGPRMVNTLILVGLSFLASIALAFPLGLIAARRPYSAADNAVNLFCFAGISIPPFWLALLLIMAFSVGLGWLPAGGVPAKVGWEPRPPIWSCPWPPLPWAASRPMPASSGARPSPPCGWISWARPGPRVPPPGAS